MGMYTEVVVKIYIDKKRIGENNYNILDYMFNPNTKLITDDYKPVEHEFFKCSRWDSVGNMSSFYHHPNRVSDWYIPPYNENDDEVYIFARNDLKDYDGEIDKFFDWINTLDIMYTDEFIGYSLYEEDNEPTIYKKKKGGQDKT